MALSKQQLAGKLAKKILSLDEKVKFFDFAKANVTLGCRKTAEIFKIRKTVEANIKEEKNIHSQHELFNKKSKKKKSLWQQKNNEILYE